MFESPKFDAELAIAKKHLERARQIAMDELPDSVLYDHTGHFNSRTEVGMLLLSITYIITQLKAGGY